jgi:ankyrin repeat protein
VCTFTYIDTNIYDMEWIRKKEARKHRYNESRLNKLEEARNHGVGTYSLGGGYIYGYTNKRKRDHAKTDTEIIDIIRRNPIGSVGAIKKLCASHPSMINKPDAKGRTPLLLACKKFGYFNYSDIVTTLLEHGASVNKVTNKNVNAAEILINRWTSSACRLPILDTFIKFVDSGLDINAQTSTKLSLLALICRLDYSNNGLLEHLIQNRATLGLAIDNDCIKCYTQTLSNKLKHDIVLVLIENCTFSDAEQDVIFLNVFEKHNDCDNFIDLLMPLLHKFKGKPHYYDLYTKYGQNIILDERQINLLTGHSIMTNIKPAKVLE